MDEPDHGKVHTASSGQGVSLAKSAPVDEVKPHFFNSKKAETVVTKVEGVKVGFKKSDKVPDSVGNDSKAVCDDKPHPHLTGSVTVDVEDSRTGTHVKGSSRMLGSDQQRVDGEAKSFGGKRDFKHDNLKLEGRRQENQSGKNDKGGYGLERDKAPKGQQFDGQQLAREQAPVDFKLTREGRTTSFADRVNDNRDDFRPNDSGKPGFKNRHASGFESGHKDDKLRIEHPGSAKPKTGFGLKQHHVEPQKGGFGDSGEHERQRNNVEAHKEDNHGRGNHQFKTNRDQKKPKPTGQGGNEDRFIKKQLGQTDESGHKSKAVDSGDDDLRYGADSFKEPKRHFDNNEVRKESFESQSKQHHSSNQNHHKHNQASGHVDNDYKKQGDRHRGHRNRPTKTNTRREENDDFEKWEPQKPKTEVDGYVKKEDDTKTKKKKNNSGESDGKQTDFGSNIFKVLATNKRN